MLFKDHFSRQSLLYAKYRPLYPTSLYSYLSTLTPEHKLAWDCGTGTGQAATALTPFYQTIIATDPSEQQIKHAAQHERIFYHVEKAEESSLDTNSADLIVVANALHWMDFKPFFTEVKRVLKDDGIFAAWTFCNPTISPEIDALIKDFRKDVIGEYWQAENKLVDQQYTTIEFPFSSIESPKFYMEKIFSLDDYIHYINTWSAVQQFISKHQENPTDNLKEQLRALWGNKELKMSWEMIIKIGRK